jgi:outer membrane protein TolC
MLAAAAQAARETPLTLAEVMARVDQDHPDTAQARARLDLARADSDLAASQEAFQVSIEAAFQGGRNRLTEDKFEPDHLARLNLRKPLWDGGRTRAYSAAAAQESAGFEAQWLDARAQRRLALMTRFFDVLLADLTYAAEDETMAVAYVAWDNAKERHQLGELSTPALAELENRFQDSRARRNDSLRRAKETRARLASAMGTPEALPANLTDPELKSNERPLPEFDVLFDTLRHHNPALRSQRLLADAARLRLDAVRADNLPSLEFEAEAAAYSRDAYTRDNLRAGVNLSWPLPLGAQADARRAREQAQANLAQARHDALLLELRQALFDTREEIEQLRGSERKAAEAERQRRDWALDKARAEYELEMRTNLGTSMADTQVAKLRARAIEYRLALAWERLDALVGTPIDSLPRENRK